MRQISGTVVIAEEGVNTKVEPYYAETILGVEHQHSTQYNPELNKALYDARGSLPVVMGKTMGTDSFYEEQCRMDGVLQPQFSEDEKKKYLQRLYDQGVRNMEMEAPVLASFCLRAGIPAANACVTLVDRLKGDQITATHEELFEYSDRTHQLVLNYIKTKI